MNIQIFGRAKGHDTKHAERFFKERRIPFQSIDLDRYGMRDKEWNSVLQSGYTWKDVVDEKSKAYKNLHFEYLPDSMKEATLREHPELMKAPIVRNGNKATVGVREDIWKKWEEESRG
ncbi:MAG: ArsC family transcriptional regulator [Erysipelotrichales bacterium]|nr:ArsC family transcriptional regulator [Erysipelotrichales bacterium]